MDYSPPPAHVQQFAGHVFNWLSRNGFPVRPYTVRNGADIRAGAQAYAYPGKIVFGSEAVPKIDAAASRWGRRGRMSEQEVKGASVMLHEALHQMRFGRTPFHNGNDDIGTPIGYEEASTEAVTRDLLPIFLAKMYGYRMPKEKTGPFAGHEGAYSRHVKNIRQMSVFGSGAGKWNDYKARVWRRKFHHATPEDREKMAQAALAQRAEWGRRTGR